MRLPIKFFALLICISCSTAFSEEYFDEDDFRVQKFNFNKERQPTQLPEVATTPEAKAVFSAVASYFGVPAVVTGIIKAIPQVKDNTSEEGEILIPLDEGYKFCDLVYEENSRAPKSGGKRARLKVIGNERNVHIPYWLKKGAVGDGRAWFDITVTVLSVRDAAYEQNKARCKPFGQAFVDYY